MTSRRFKRKKLEDEKQLYFAISDNDPKRLEKLIQDGIDIDMNFNGSNQWGKSALHLCCEKGHFGCAALLVTAGALTDQQDEWYQTPLMYSVCTERPEMVKFLIQSGCSLDTQDRYGKTALHFAVSNSEIDCLKLLIEGGVDVDSYEETGRTPLWLAASEDGHQQVLQYLIQSGAEVNCYDLREKRTPLQAAIKHSKTDTLEYVKILLQNGADVNTVDAYGWTSMTNLICKTEVQSRHIPDSQLEIAELLIGAGYDVNVYQTPSHSYRYHGTALKAAAERGAVTYVTLLLAQGADPDIHDMYLATPLMYAVQNNHLDVVKLLLAANCKTDIVALIHVGGDPTPATPFHNAIFRAHWDIAQLFVLTGYDLQQERYLITNTNVPNALVENYEFWGWLRDVVTNSPSLLELCRKKIRQILTFNMDDKVTRLPIPKSLKDYILMRDLLRVNHT